MRRPSPPVALAAALATALAARIGFRAARELRGFRRDRARLVSRWITIPGVVGPSPLRVHTRFGGGAFGSPTPIVLVHGLGVGSAYHVPLMAYLANTAPVYALDLPGHGRSDHDVRPLKARELAQALGGWMDAVGLDGVLLVGHSYGCQIVTELAVTRPELVSRVVLIGPMADPAAASAPRVLARAAVTIPLEPPSFLLLGLADFGRAGLAVLATDLREMLSYRIETAVALANQPVAVMRGARDHLAPRAWAARLAQCAGAPPPQVVPGCAHAVNYAAPAFVAEAIRPAW